MTHATLRCTRCGKAQALDTVTVRQCECGSKSYRITYETPAKLPNGTGVFQDSSDPVPDSAS